MTFVFCSSVLGSSLIRVHIICFHEKIKLEVHLNICGRRKKKPDIFRTKIMAGKGLKKNLMAYLEVFVQNISVVSSSTGKYNIFVSVKFCHNHQKFT